MGRRHSKNDSHRFYSWMKAAREDIATAQILLRENKCFNACAFHCQQAVEKALKAYVLISGEKLLDGHNLTWLCRQAAKYDPDFSSWLGESIELNRCYIETRYPTDLAETLSNKKINRIYSIAKDMFDYICMQVDPDD